MSAAEKIDESDAFRALLRESLSAFTQKCFHELCPADTYRHNWHIDAIARHLEYCALGGITRLIITMPPRSLKSICGSVALPAWALGHDPQLRCLMASYSADLAAKHARDCRKVMQSAWFRAAFPDCRIDRHKSGVSEFETTRGGSRLTTSVGGTVTGRGGDIIVIDDPIKPDDAMSDSQREAANQWFDGTLYSRLNDKRQGCIVVIMQRLHPDDLVGHILEQEDWVHLNLPAIAERTMSIEVGPDRTYLRREGEVLQPEREPLTILDRIKATMGSAAFSAQYQQAPVPPGGGMIKADWFRRYQALPNETSGSLWVYSWDTASKAEEIHDYSVGIRARIEGDRVYIIDVVRERLGYPELRRKIAGLARRDGADTVLIEDKGSGTALIQDLDEDGIRVVGITPEGDKVTRMSAQSARIEAGQVFIPEAGDWIDEFLTEMMRFPKSRHDDQVDALSQLLRWQSEHSRRTLTVHTLAF